MRSLHYVLPCLLLACASSLAPSGALASSSAASPQEGAKPSANAPTDATAAANQPANDAATRSGRAGTLRAQVLLLRAYFGSGEIDGLAGRNLAGALRGFQARNGLAVTGKLDAATWKALDRDDAPVLVDYTLTAEDVAGPFAPTPDEPDAKAKMARLVYQDIGEMLGERFAVKPTLLRALNPQADFAKAGTVLAVPNVLAAQAVPKAARVLVDKSDGVLQLLDQAGAVLAQFPASTGSAKFPLPIGDWKVTTVVHDPDYRYDPELLEGQPKDAQPAMLPPGPNGPVGLVWIGIDKPHYGIHGTPEPGTIGRAQSSGCVRLTNFAAQAVASAVAAGTPVTFRE